MRAICSDFVASTQGTGSAPERPCCCVCCVCCACDDNPQVNAAAAQAEAALTAFQAGLPLPPSAVGLPSALTPGSTGAAMAAAGNLAAGGHNAAAAAAGVLPGVLPGLGDMGVLAGGLLPTPYVVVGGMISAAVLEDDEEYEEVRLAVCVGGCFSFLGQEVGAVWLNLVVKRGLGVGFQAGSRGGGCQVRDWQPGTGVV